MEGSGVEGEPSSRESHSPLYKWNSCPSYLDPPKCEKNEIFKIHIYDFDNTLFRSPAPNPNLLTSFMVNILTDPHRLSNGGWWSETRFLQALIDEWISEKALSGSHSDTLDAAYWNKDIVQLTRLSENDPHTLSILMTGRKEALFKDSLGRVLSQPVFGTKKLHFNGVFLKKAGFETTMLYKTSCLTELLKHYDQCEEITIYDDRARQLEGFRKFLNEFVEALRPSLRFSLVHVAGLIKYLKPSRERSTISAIFDEHNAAVTNRLYQPDSRPVPFYMGKMYVKEKRSGAAYILTASSRQKVVKFTMESFGDSHGLSSPDVLFDSKAIPCTPYGTITSRKVATMVLTGCANDPSEEKIDEIMDAMNNGVENSCIQFRLTRFGVTASGRCVYDTEPVPSSRYVYTDFPALRLPVAMKMKQEDEMSEEMYDDKNLDWTVIRGEDILIDTDFGYLFAITAVMAKKQKGSRKGVSVKALS